MSCVPPQLAGVATVAVLTVLARLLTVGSSAVAVLAVVHHYPSATSESPSDFVVRMIVDGEQWPTVYSYPRT